MSNTCAFDSALSIYTAGFLDNEKMHNVIDGSVETQNSFSFFIKNILQRGDRKSNKEHYETRTCILYQLYTQFYKKQVSESVHTIDIVCTTTFGPFLKKLLLEIDGGILCSITIRRSCVLCRREYNDHQPLMELKFVNKINLKRLSQYIVLGSKNTSDCRKCRNRLRASVEYGNIIAFDVEPLTEKYITKTIIEEIQDTLHIDDRIYKLFGVVEFVRSNIHFKAHVKRSNGIWETYEDLQKEITRTKTCSTTPMVVFAVFYIAHSV